MMERLTATVISIDHWLSVKEYAQAAGIQTRAVHFRFRRGMIAGAMIDGQLVIDSELSPTTLKLTSRWQPAPEFVWPTDMPPLGKLVQMRNFCDRNGIRGHELYRDIILGKVKAWYFAEQVYVEDDPALQAYVTHRRRRGQIR